MCEQKVMLNTCINPRPRSMFVFNIYLCDKVIIHVELKEMRSYCIVNTLTINMSRCVSWIWACKMFVKSNICKQKVVFHHYTSKIVENNFYLQQIKSFQIINRLVKIVLNLWFKIFTASLALLSSGKNFALMIAKATKSKALPVQRVLCFILVSPVISSQYPHNMNSKCCGPKL